LELYQDFDEADINFKTNVESKWLIEGVLGTNRMGFCLFFDQINFLESQLKE
jgi:hypothetical protein